VSAPTRIATRSSTALRAVVEGYGPLSVATRALLILGALALGTPVAALEAEILDLDLGALEPAVRLRLLAVLHSGATDGVHDPLPALPAAEATADDDLFGTGFDV
jgi:hypothetical protein